MAPLISVYTYSLSSTNKFPFQSNTDVNAIANPCQLLYQFHTGPNRDFFASLTTSFSIPPVNLINRPPIIIQNNTVLFVAMNKSVISFDGLVHQKTPEEYLHQIDAQMILTMGKQTFDPVAYERKHQRKRAFVQCSLSGIA